MCSFYLRLCLVCMGKKRVLKFAPPAVWVKKTKLLLPREKRSVSSQIILCSQFGCTYLLAAFECFYVWSATFILLKMYIKLSSAVEDDRIVAPVDLNEMQINSTSTAAAANATGKCCNLQSININIYRGIASAFSLISFVVMLNVPHFGTSMIYPVKYISGPVSLFSYVLVDYNLYYYFLYSESGISQLPILQFIRWSL